MEKPRVETVWITVGAKRYRDLHGQPSCALDYLAGEACPFCRPLAHSPNEALCVVAPGGPRQVEQRAQADGGTLAPGPWCPLWKEGK